MSRSGAAYLLAGQAFGPTLHVGRSFSHTTVGVTTATPGNTNARFGPLWIPPGHTFDRIGLTVTGAGGAGSVIRLGLYQDDGTGLPGALLLDAGTIDGTSATQQDITLAGFACAGLVWTVAVPQGAPVGEPILRASAGVHVQGYPSEGSTSAASTDGDFGFSVAGFAAGALPAQAAGIGPTTIAVPRVILRPAT